MSRQPVIQKIARTIAHFASTKLRGPRWGGRRIHLSRLVESWNLAVVTKLRRPLVQTMIAPPQSGRRRSANSIHDSGTRAHFRFATRSTHDVCIISESGLMQCRKKCSLGKAPFYAALSSASATGISVIVDGIIHGRGNNKRGADAVAGVAVTAIAVTAIAVTTVAVAAVAAIA